MQKQRFYKNAFSFKIHPHVRSSNFPKPKPYFMKAILALYRLWVVSICLFLISFANASTDSIGSGNLGSPGSWVDDSPPAINSFSPASGPVGTLVTITGTNLNSPTAFTIGGVSAIAVSNDGTSLVGMVMPAAQTGAVSVTTAGGTTAAVGNFTVSPTPFPSVQQGDKLVGSGAVGNALQGYSISVSADGNTALVGGYLDNGGAGAAWVYTRSGGIWTQQGNKLVGIDAEEYSGQGWSVSFECRRQYRPCGRS